MSHATPTLYATTTASASLAAGAGFEWLATADGRALLAFLGSSLLTFISAAIALRTQAVQARVERSRIEREAAREAARQAREDAREEKLAEVMLGLQIAAAGKAQLHSSLHDVGATVPAAVIDAAPAPQ